MSALSVAVVGGGPVGLYQALSLHQAGMRPVILERRSEPREGSRSIGIHPPSLELLDELGLARRFVDAGVRVRRGHALGASGERVGTVDFARAGGRFGFVLSLPQHRTEAFLVDAVEQCMSGCLRWGTEVTGLDTDGKGVRVETREGAVDADWVVACDGRRSPTRERLGIAFDAEPYEGTYGMEDHTDTTPFGHEAAVFLAEEGLVESFPLPGGMRRWVARIDGRPLRATVAERTGFRLPDDDARTSVFRAERGIAGRLVEGRVVLAGDAAHVVSPIGGQGMNLGWLGAKRISEALAQAAEGDVAAVERDAPGRRRMAHAAARRAEANMWLGRPTAWSRLRERIVGALLRRPMADGLARAFTMRGLRWGL